MIILIGSNLDEYVFCSLGSVLNARARRTATFNSNGCHESADYWSTPGGKKRKEKSCRNTESQTDVRRGKKIDVIP